MKISKYISKYNYIDFFTKPKGLWFFSIQEIETKLNYEIEYFSKNKKGLVYKEMDEGYDEYEELDDGVDSYEYYKYLKENGELLEDDRKNIYIIQGNIIDKESRNYIISKNSDIKTIVDLEEHLKFKNNEEQALKTKKLLTENKDIIIFQPVFIYKNLITKPDALIKKDNEIKIVETKGTTSAKAVHYLDLFFQMNVIENQNYLKDLNCIYDYELCLISYEYLNKNQISLETTPYINLSKTVSTSTLSNKKLDAKELIIEKNNLKKGKSSFNGVEPLKIKDLMYSNFNTLETNIECSEYAVTRNKFKNALEKLKRVNNRFDDDIDALQKAKDKLNKDSLPYFEPSVNDKSWFKNCDYFATERKLYSLMGYNIYEYSGNVANQTIENISNVKKNDNIKNFLKQPKENMDFYINLFSNKNIGLINNEQCVKLLNKLHPNKVYFDFETINSAIRVIDNSLPFMQIVTQCSIIKSQENDDQSKLTCENLIIDPKKIDISWFKKIIDSLYFGPKVIVENDQLIVDGEHNTSYIVYNKSFECSRLKEMAKFIKEKEYTFKVEEINKNIYDLADFFKLSASKKKDKTNYYIFFKELHGFYSIKKVLPLVGKYNNDIYQQIKCLDYTTLEIGNGQVCQEETSKRFFGLISDSDWLTMEENMKIYCENDVRSMLAIEIFIYFLLENYDREIN